MNPLTKFLQVMKKTRNHPCYQQLELPLGGRELTRAERLALVRLQRLRERIRSM